MGMAWQATWAVAVTTARDCSRRGALILLLVVGCLMMLALRYLSIYGMGEELNLLREFGIGNLALGGAVGALLCAVPVSRSAAVMGADRVLLVRAVPAWVVTVGRWAGAAMILAGMFAVWCVFMVIALGWFALAEPTIFTMARETTVKDELISLATPTLLALLQSVMLAGFAVCAAVRGGMAAAAAVILGIMLAGILIPSAAGTADANPVVYWLALLLPDTRLYSSPDILYGGVGATWVTGAALQALGYGAGAAWFGAKLAARV